MAGAYKALLRTLMQAQSELGGLRPKLGGLVVAQPQVSCVVLAGSSTQAQSFARGWLCSRARMSRRACSR